MDFEIDMDKLARKILRKKAKKVLLQFPDGLKPKAASITNKLERETKAKIFIWFGSNFGACDIPNVEKQDFDLLINFGHSEWKY